MKTLIFTGLFLFLPFFVVGQVQVGQTLSNSEPWTGFGESLRITGDGLTVAVTATEECRDLNSSRGVTRVYQLRNNLWVQKGNDLKHNYFASGSGLALSDDGNTVAIGSSNAITQVFSYNGSDWVQKGANIVKGGRGIDLSSDGNAISVSTRDSVLILEYVNSLWEQKGSTIIGDQITRFGFNTRLNSDATGIIIAAPGVRVNGNFNVGCAYVYEYSNSDWSQKGTRMCGNDGGDYFSGGRFNHGAEKSIGISDDLDVVIVSSSEQGYSKLYEFSGANWSQVGSDVSEGFAVDISSDGSTFVTTDPYTNNASGVNIYKLNGSTVISSTIIDFGCNGCGALGSAVELTTNGEMLAIADPFDFNDVLDVPFAGYVQVFDLTQPALPIQLLSFHATPTQKQAHLRWSTTTETQNAYFHVQHAPDGQNWQDIGRVAGAGTTETVQEYTFTHNNPVQGDNYYRLRQEDFDGTTDYSPVRQVWLDGAGEQLILSPNPATDRVAISRPEGLTTTALQLTNVNGRVVRQIAADATTFSVADLPAGVYLLRTDNNESTPVRLIVR